MQTANQNTFRQPYLSVVVTSRNDNHGGSLTQRMQCFLDGLFQQVDNYSLDTELIIVEWNPPKGRSSVKDTFLWPKNLSKCVVRIITVPAELHEQYAHSGQLPLFQMIAKNVGIRRAKGEFVLATNIDILFSKNIMSFLKDKLKHGQLYRADRLDVPADVPRSGAVDDVLLWCSGSFFRINANGHTSVRPGKEWDSASLSTAYQNPKLRVLSRIFTMTNPNGLRRAKIGELAKILISSIVSNLSQKCHTLRTLVIDPALHTNACGDFTLLSKSDWFLLRGYAEWPMYSFHIDSILLYQAWLAGIREYYVGRDAPVYHIEHGFASGYVAENPTPLFDRLKSMGVPFLDWNAEVVPLIESMRSKKVSDNSNFYLLNDENWGLVNFELKEELFGGAS